ncbi:ABC transporter ATP-binding protein [Vibrio diazotrophicus]|nr:ABC transporter ATP-binding protein [Vibrio diazotrophicus]
MSCSSKNLSEDRNVAIKVSALNKFYPIFEKPQYRLFQMLFGRSGKKYYEEFHALENISFSVKKGETVGIVGRNGSGKSTLLQLICQTLTPSSGHVEVNGRVAALLELGAGFNPEFTGLENIYMAASIYGLTKIETDNRLDSITNFADIGPHLEQPVKTYSSGMYVRLAFAVIAHVDADVLIIDEALAVGDAAFTQKCMRFIREFKKKGTLLFVSHDMHSILNLCEKALWLEKGKMKSIGDAKEISENYLQATLQDVYDVELHDIDSGSCKTGNGDNLINENIISERGWCSGAAEITSFELLSSGSDNFIFSGGENVDIKIRVKAFQDIEKAIVGITVKDRLGQALFAVNTYDYYDPMSLYQIAKDGFLDVTLKFKMPKLVSGSYFISVSMAEGDIHVHTQHTWIHDIAKIDIHTNEPRFGYFSVDSSSVVNT